MKNLYDKWTSFIGSPYTQGFHWKLSLISLIAVIIAIVALFVSILNTNC